MTLAHWEAKGWLRKHQTSRQEVLKLLNEAESDLGDARRALPAVWRFSLACTAALNLCKLLLYSSGYRSEDQFHHKIVQSLPIILGEAHNTNADYLASSLKQSAQQSIQSDDAVAPQQVDAMIRFSEDLYQQAIDWLRSLDPSLVTNSDMTLSQESDWVLSFVEA